MSIEKRVEKAIQDDVFQGCVIGIIKNGERRVMAFGTQGGKASVQENTIYDVASVTKSIPLASLALTFIAEGKFSLNEKVKKYLPELQNDFDATIEDLLRYRVHGSQMSALKYETFEEIRTHIFERGFDGPPGDSYYTNLPAFLLGIILERVGGEILPALSEKYFFGPLNMHDTTFFPHDIERIAPTEIVDGEEIRGIVHDESARMFAKKRRAVGHAGLFSTVPDLLTFTAALLDTNFPAVTSGAQKGLGWQVNEEWMGKGRSAKTFGKTGFTGTSIVCDIERNTAFVILSNRTYPHRPPDQSAINSFRADIADIILVQ